MLGRALNYPAVAAVALSLPVSVSAVADPPVVDRSSTGTATTVSKEQLEQLPTSRDVRSIIDAVPTPSPSPPPASSVPPQLQTPASDGERLLKQLWLEAEALGLQAQEAARRCDRNGLAAALQRLYQMEQQVRAMVNSARQARVRGQIPAINPALGVAVHEHIARIYIPANRLTLQNCGERPQDIIGGPIIRPSPMPTPRDQVGSTPPMPTPRHQVGSTLPRLDPFNQRILDLHNAERTALGLQPFYWNQSLAAGAQAYADELGRTGQLSHASRKGRGTVRENLNTGMRGWNADQMMANWLNEKNRFTPGIFPNVCAGDWFECAHYTQIIWIETIEIGCGRAQGRVYVFLVCRYNPGGNKDGKPVGFPAMSSPRHVAGSTPPMPQPRRVVGSTPASPQLRGTVGTPSAKPGPRSTPSDIARAINDFYRARDNAPATTPISDRPATPAQVSPLDRAILRVSEAQEGFASHRAAADPCKAEDMRKWQQALDRLARDARREAEAARAAGEFAQIDAHMAELFAAEIQRLANLARSRECGTPSRTGPRDAPIAENELTSDFGSILSEVNEASRNAFELGNVAGLRRAIANWESLHRDIKRAIVEASKGRSFTPQLRRLFQIESELRSNIDKAKTQIQQLSAAG